MKQKFLVLFISLFSAATCAIAQVELAVKVEQNPSEFLPGIINRPDLRVKERIILTQRGAGINKPDTLSITKYDNKGMESNNIGFEKNRRESFTDYSWSADRKTRYWKNFTKTRPENFSANKTVYYKGEEILWFENYEVVKGDTIDRPLVNFYYNDNGQLTRKKQSRKAVVFMNDSYSYNGEDMVRAEIKMRESVATHRYDYSYDKDHLPVKKQESFMRGDKEEVFRTTYFTYLNHKLISKTFPDYADPKLEAEIDYTYDKSGRISTIRAKCDTLYRNVRFFYDGSQLIRAEGEGNTMIKFSEIFWIYTRGSFNQKPEFTFSKELFYDQKGALIKILDKINGQQDAVTEYVLKYY